MENQQLYWLLFELLIVLGIYSSEVEVVSWGGGWETGKQKKQHASTKKVAKYGRNWLAFVKVAAHVPHTKHTKIVALKIHPSQ